MLRLELQHDRRILVVTPEGPLSTSDFERFAQEVDLLIALADTNCGHLDLHEVVSGWQNVRALCSHLKFVISHHRHIDRIAAANDNALLKMLSSVAGFFVHPKIRHFRFEEKDRALAWLETGE